MDVSRSDALLRARQHLHGFARALDSEVEAGRFDADHAEQVRAALRSACVATVRALASAVAARDHVTGRHLDRTYRYAVALTKLVKPELADNAAVGYGYLLHDVGKLAVPDSILCKPGPLTDDEWEVMRGHPEEGAKLVEQLAFLDDAVQVIRWHHERFDGRGYPDQLKGEDIPLPARIFSVVDTFDAMTNDRPYRKGLSVEYALEEIDRVAGTQLDPTCAAKFIELVSNDQLPPVPDLAENLDELSEHLERNLGQRMEDSSDIQLLAS